MREFKGDQACVCGLLLLTLREKNEGPELARREHVGGAVAVNVDGLDLRAEGGGVVDELRDETRTHSVGTTRAGRWYVGPPAK